MSSQPHVRIFTYCVDQVTNKIPNSPESVSVVKVIPVIPLLHQVSPIIRARRAAPLLRSAAATPISSADAAFPSVISYPAWVIDPPRRAR
jgi:hypothetical protein